MKTIREVFGIVEKKDYSNLKTPERQSIEQTEDYSVKKAISVKEILGNIFKFLGSTSGTLTLKASNSTTSYTLIMPSAQGGANTFLKNNGSGSLSWDSFSGGVTGGGASGCVAFWNSAINLTYNAEFTFNTISGKMVVPTSVGVNIPSTTTSRLHAYNDRVDAYALLTLEEELNDTLNNVRQDTYQAELRTPGDSNWYVIDRYSFNRDNFVGIIINAYITASANSVNHGAFSISAGFFDDAGGGATQIGVTANILYVATANLQVQFVCNGDDVEIQVRDDGSTGYWHITWNVQESRNEPP